MADFFIVGAPKCGTTALHRYLSAHPAIFMSAMKEPGRFNTDLLPNTRYRDHAAYRGLFDAAPADALKGEATTLYLYSSVAIGNILREYPAAKFVVVLRNPIHAVQSMHRQLLTTWDEDIENFEQAWDAQSDRSEGRRLPPYCPEPKLLQYGALFSYASQLERLFGQVSAQNRHVIIYEEFFAAPRSAYDSLLEFLGLSPDQQVDFRRVNFGVAPYSRRLHLLLRPERFFSQAIEARLRKILHPIRVRPRTLLRQLNSRPGEGVVLDKALTARLIRFFEPDVRALEGITGKNLRSLWF